MKISLKIGRVPGASLHLSARGLYSIRTFGSIITNDEGAFPIWFQFSLLESSSKDKIPFIESPWLDEFLPLAKGSMMVLDHFNCYSISFLFELVQGLRELRGVISAKGFEYKLNENQRFSSKCKGVQGFPGGLFQSGAIGPKYNR